MNLKVEVELYQSFGGRDAIIVTLDEDDIKQLAEQKAQKEYECCSCAAKRIELIGEFK